MKKFASTLRFWSLLVAIALALGACSDDSGGDSNNGNNGEPDVVDDAVDATTDAGDTADAVDAADAHDVQDTADTDTTADTGLGSLCQPCTEDTQCGGPDDLCLQMPAGDQSCMQSCDPDVDQPCPQGYFCASLGDDGQVNQCVPEELTCVDRCADVSCGADEVCEPWTGDCIEPLGICDTGCTTASTCGDGPDDVCIGMPGTSGERACLTGCNPQAEVSECPINYFCTSTSTEEDSTEGICFPLEGTCTDRCSGVDCPAGQNCDGLTGQCEDVEFGYCESGCSTDAECAGPTDRCFDLGIGDGAHCWQDCSDNSDICIENYECATLRGTTVSICLPLGRSCDECIDTDCYPGGICDPATGDCVDIEQDCTEVGCQGDLLCDPVSTRCVEPGRACSGDSWASDCDNVVTACTTRRAGTTGTCEEICSNDADCGAGTSCVETDLHKFCLPDDLNGPLTCGTLRDVSSPVGRPCGAGLSSCPSGANRCVQAANLDGFCSHGCTDDSQCDAGQTCRSGPDGQNICVPAQCRCAVTPGLGADLSAAWTTALGQAQLGQCELWLDRRLADGLEQLDATPLAHAALVDLLAFPMAAVDSVDDYISELDAASGGPTAALEAAAATLDLSISATAGSYSYPGSESKLTQAVADFITAAGGSPDTTQLELEAQDVPADFQDVAAPIISAAAEALTARDQALQQAGFDAARRAEAFDGGPFLLLPGTTAQLGARPDLQDPATAAVYEGFPVEELAAAAADLSATIEDATNSAGDPSGWTGFEYVVDTPAGKIILGDAQDTTYDPAVDRALAGDIAVLIDAGGDDVYRLPVGANQSVENGVSLLVDMGGSDEYTYAEVSDPNDAAELLPADADGRQTPAGPLNQHNGPVSLSTTARQGAGRLGIGMLIDLGADSDDYRSLRISQGAAVFGVGLLFDEGGPLDTFDAEALSQGAAIKGLGVLWSGGGDDLYRVWHAGQGFGAASGAGVLVDTGGDDVYEAVTGEAGGAGVLYLSRADRARSNRNLAQGAGVGVASDAQNVGLGGGLGILRDRSGADDYLAGTYAQGFGSVRGLGVLADAAGSDAYNGRAMVQGVGELFAGGLLIEEAGSDTYNQQTLIAQNGQGMGRNLGWGVFYDIGGDDTLTYLTPGGGVGLDAGFGFAFLGAGVDSHDSSTSASWGFAQNSTAQDSPLFQQLTVGVFLDAGADTDTYSRPNIDPSVIGNDLVWSQPPDSPLLEERGVGVDQ